MDIVQISTWPPAHCGIATYCAQLTTALRELGQNVTIFAECEERSSGKNRDEHDNVWRIWRRGCAFSSMHGLGAVLKAVDSSTKKPDIVHIQHEFGLFATYDYQALLDGLADRRIPCVVTLHTVMGEPYRQDFYGGEEANQYIVHTQAGKLIAESRGLDHVTIVPHGAIARKPDYVPSDCLRGLCPGFVSPSKGHREIIEAVANTLHRLTIVGEIRDESYRTKLTELVYDLGLNQTTLAPHVALDLGWKTNAEMQRYFEEVDFVVLGNDGRPTYSASGQAHTALGYGLPIFAKDVPIYREVSGAILWKDADELKQLLRGLSPHNLPRTHLPDSYTWQAVAKTHLGIYRSMVDLE